MSDSKDTGTNIDIGFAVLVFCITITLNHPVLKIDLVDALIEHYHTSTIDLKEK